MSAAADARRARLGKAFSAWLCVLYLESQDKHKCVWWPRSGRKAVGKAQREHAGTRKLCGVLGVIYCRLVWHYGAAIV